MEKAVKELSDVIGIPVTIQWEWSMIWSQLENFFPDKTIFVPTINSIISVWQSSLQTKLEDKDEEGWSDRFLEEVKGKQALVVRPEVCVVVRPFY